MLVSRDPFLRGSVAGDSFLRHVVGLEGNWRSLFQIEKWQCIRWNHG